MTNLKLAGRTIGVTIVAVMLIVVFDGCRGRAEHTSEGISKAGVIEAQPFRTDHGWGYAIFINDKLFIKQSIIPVIEGNRSFEKEEDAARVGDLVVSKLKHHQKPFIRLDELRQLDVLHN